ncbi:RNA-binding protein, putative [Hondaea fermentalgiana]|uniref:RNA-binding protein, putative n=1 Tax=Hondaea fermentalgiana TaxID=2315210 RepID=A0A2R5GDD3_9STRA|nr:RNA-binding protein, putative [Hondaea fermentalgiana]|eukprot:GBG28947.1 RNA-binding protein, putative [Hondaea fermentalgiana]
MTETKLYVRNLPWSATEDSLRETFGAHGEPTFVRLCTDRDTGRSRGFGFVSFADEATANKAMGALNGVDMDGRNIAVALAEGRPAGGNQGGRNERQGGGDRVCFSFQKSGSCKFGDSCRFSHGAGAPAGGNSFNNGGGFAKKPCFAFQNNGSCKFGDTCRFAHGDDAAPASNDAAPEKKNPKRVEFNDSDDEEETKAEKAQEEPASEPAAADEDSSDSDSDDSDDEKEEVKKASSKKRDAAESSDDDSSSDSDSDEEEKPKKKAKH